jgi:hypothetical protein
MSEVCRITVPIDINDTNPNRIAGASFYTRTIRKRNAWTAARMAWIAAGKPVATGRVITHLIVRRGRALDESNIWSAAKHLIDGLFVGAITPDDSPKHVRLGLIEQEISPDWKAKPEVIFIVELL